MSGYVASDFGDRPTQPQPARPQAQPIAQAPAAKPAVAAPALAQAAPAPIAVQPAPITALPPVKTKKASKVPLILTIVGVVVFIGGVAGLFIYALAGK